MSYHNHGLDFRTFHFAKVTKKSESRSIMKLRAYMTYMSKKIYLLGGCMIEKLSKVIQKIELLILLF